jgi:hypothetical protein
MMWQKRRIIQIVILVTILQSGCTQNLYATPSINVTQQITPLNSPYQTPISTGTPIRNLYLTTDAQKRMLQLLFTNGGCDLPCFWGITPGKTTWDYANVFFSTFHEINTNVLYYTDGSLPAYDVPLDIIDSKNRYIGLGIALTVGEKIVQRLSIYTEAHSAEDLNSYWAFYSLGWIFSQLGPPNQILIDIYSNDIEHYPGYDLLVIYQKYKIAFWLTGDRSRDYMICPQIGENYQITHLEISIANPDSGLDILPPDWEFWSPHKQSTHSIEDILLMLA